MSLTIHTEIDGDGSYGTDTMYIHGAEIVDPANNHNATLDESVDPAQYVYTVTVESDEDEQPYREALAAVGITVTGTNDDGDWTGYQTRPLPM